MAGLSPDFLCGSYPPLVTPFREGEVDYEAYASLVERQVAQGSHGIVVNGTTAEPSLLSIHERRRLVETAVETARGRLPVVAATGSQSLADTLELSEHATAAGCDALLVVTPYYVRPPQRGLVEYFAAVAERSDLPLLVYHIPGRAAVGVTVDTLQRLVQRAPSVVGIKHASTDLGLVTEMLSVFGPQWRVLAGLEDLTFPMLAVGASGMVNAVGNLAPAAVAALYQAVRDGDLGEARRLHFALDELNRAVFFDTNPIPLKYLMHRTGILANEEHRLPMMPADPTTGRRLDGVIERAGQLLDERTRVS